MTQSEIDITKKLVEETRELKKELFAVEILLQPLLDKRNALNKEIEAKNLGLTYFQCVCTTGDHKNSDGTSALKRSWHDNQSEGYVCEICGIEVVH